MQQQINPTTENTNGMPIATQSHGPTETEQHTGEEQAAQMQRLVIDLSLERQTRVLSSATTMASLS